MTFGNVSAARMGAHISLSFRTSVHMVEYVFLQILNRISASWSYAFSQMSVFIHVCPKFYNVILFFLILIYGPKNVWWGDGDLWPWTTSFCKRRGRFWEIWRNSTVLMRTGAAVRSQTFWPETTKIWSVHPRVQFDTFVRFEDLPSRRVGCRTTHTYVSGHSCCRYDGITKVNVTKVTKLSHTNVLKRS